MMKVEKVKEHLDVLENMADRCQKRLGRQRNQGVSHSAVNCIPMLSRLDLNNSVSSLGKDKQYSAMQSSNPIEAQPSSSPNHRFSKDMQSLSPIKLHSQTLKRTPVKSGSPAQEVDFSILQQSQESLFTRSVSHHPTELVKSQMYLVT